ncbi:MAG: hypothetical protein QOF78_3665 [Phycisphaerales bacterium]|jgi:hypothetical protein|nr:hypothetical protein [Phycisphaerales bacterium]MEA2735693.1 hypothetical protein [Humisphaera sp.]
MIRKPIVTSPIEKDVRLDAGGMRPLQYPPVGSPTKWLNAFAAVLELRR